MGNFLFNVKYVSRHPRFLSQYIRRKNNLSNLLQTEVLTIDNYLIETKLFTNELYNHLSKYPYLGYGDRRKNEILYVIVRICKPDIVVETGVASGVSSYYILKALRKNQKGRLYSIDMGERSFDGLTLPQEKSIGWLVPQHLKDRWSLILGKSSEKLSPLLKELGHTDLFLHDSDHSYANMFWEFNAAYPYLSKRGVVLSDNIELNNAFIEFATSHSMKYLELFGFGIAIKNGAE